MRFSTYNHFVVQSQRKLHMTTARRLTRPLVISLGYLMRTTARSQSSGTFWCSSQGQCHCNLARIAPSRLFETSIGYVTIAAHVRQLTLPSWQRSRPRINQYHTPQPLTSTKTRIATGYAVNMILSFQQIRVHTHAPD